MLSLTADSFLVVFPGRKKSLTIFSVGFFTEQMAKRCPVSAVAACCFFSINNAWMFHLPSLIQLGIVLNDFLFKLMLKYHSPILV